MEKLPADVDLLCKTPCVETVRAYFTKCERSQDARTKVLFSTSNWRSVLDTCDQRDGGAAAAGSGGKGGATQEQCSGLKRKMTSTLAKLCCADGTCSSLPATCSLTCSAQLMPFFRECAGHLQVTDRTIMGRLTELAQICAATIPSDGGH